MGEIVFLILLHIFGDFYLQTNNIAIGKSNSYCNSNKFVNYKYLTLHSLLYTIPFSILFFFTEWWKCLLILGICLISHWLMDLFTCWFKGKTKKTFAFLLDQSVHILFLFLIFDFFPFGLMLSENYLKIIYGLTIVLFLIKPSIVIVNHIFIDIFGISPSIDSEKFDVGAIIGVFERIIVLVLAIFNAITAVAIIVTVKTWARNKDIKDNVDNFGNRYLVGTLCSISLALIAAYLWCKLI